MLLTLVVDITGLTCVKLLHAWKKGSDTSWQKIHIHANPTESSGSNRLLEPNINMKCTRFIATTDFCHEKVGKYVTWSDFTQHWNCREYVIVIHVYSDYTCIQWLYIHTVVIHVYSDYTCIQWLYIHTVVIHPVIII